MKTYRSQARLMGKCLFLFLTTLTLQCSSGFDPKVDGKTIYHDWNIDKIVLNQNGQITEIKLPTTDSLDFNSPIWLKGQDSFLIKTTEREQSCYTYSIVLFDTNGKLKDTIFTPSPCTVTDFMPSPDDNLLLIRNYNYNDWKTTMIGPVNYFIYDLKNKTLQDSIEFEESRLSLEDFHETIWSPDSRRVIITKEERDKEQTAFIYDLNQTSVLLDTGKNFIWSPHRNEIVSYIKNNKIIFKNLSTHQIEEFYTGGDHTQINDFRWDPKGEYLVVNLNGHSMNIESKATWKPTSIFISVNDKQEQKRFSKHTVIDSWK